MSTCNETAREGPVKSHLLGFQRKDLTEAGCERLGIPHLARSAVGVAETDQRAATSGLRFYRRRLLSHGMTVQPQHDVRGPHRGSNLVVVGPIVLCDEPINETRSREPPFSIDRLLVACDGFEYPVRMARRHLGYVAIEIHDRPCRVALNHGVNVFSQIVDLACEGIGILENVCSRQGDAVSYTLGYVLAAMWN